ncbi:ABC transporter substrate-binding protein [Paenibacillus agilis]|uniref:Extracellular solute-binding protein n=1 Tax=Paenibacillus agilis TaxID=3020863 RepID=A0A559IHC5_9BACL|nr:extracellular solute-binding protein [Paenibacillus agilis]TVX86833.1 extracellular solute-binding protein [Paenibacillus agilis]
MINLLFTYKRSFCTFIVLSMLLSGCLIIPDKPQQQAEKVKLKVLVEREYQFWNDYAKIYSMQYPNVEFELINREEIGMDYTEPLDNEALQQLTQTYKPDIIILSTPQYKQLASQGLLESIEHLIKKDEFDVQNILPSITEELRLKGGGQLYGLAPYFKTEALLYNADLFKKYGIEPPHHQMTWEQVLQLAHQMELASNDSVDGLSISYQEQLGKLIVQMGRTNQLAFLDKATGQPRLNTPEWKQLFEEAIQAYLKGGVYSPKEEPSYYFKTLEGNVAMERVSDFASFLSESSRAFEDQNKRFSWSMVTMPVHSSNPDIASGMQITSIWSISRTSAHKQAAWEFIKYFNSDVMAKSQTYLTYYGISTRTAYIKAIPSKELEALTKLKPNPNQPSAAEHYAAWNLEALINEKIEQITANPSTLHETILNLQHQLTEKMTEYYVTEKNNSNR